MMINDFTQTRPRSWRTLCTFILALMVSPPVALHAESASAPKAPRYKKNTVVDFEGALVEGKSRKPYSAYLTQQRESAYGDLHQWSPDLDRSLLNARKKMDKSL